MHWLKRSAPQKPRFSSSKASSPTLAIVWLDWKGRGSWADECVAVLLDSNFCFALHIAVFPQWRKIGDLTAWARSRGYIMIHNINRSNCTTRVHQRNLLPSRERLGCEATAPVLKAVLTCTCVLSVLVPVLTLKRNAYCQCWVSDTIRYWNNTSDWNVPSRCRHCEF